MAEGEEIEDFSLTELQQQLLFNDKDFQRVVARVVFKDSRDILKSYSDMVIDRVCDDFDVDREELMSNSRKDAYVIPRYVCMYILFTEMKVVGLTRKEITTLFNRDRSIINHAVQVVEWEMSNSKKLTKLVTNIRKLIQIKKKYE